MANINLNDPAVQALIQNAANAVVAAYQNANPQQPGPRGPPGLPGDPGRDRRDENNNGNGHGSSKWNPADIGFFNPFHDNKTMEQGSAPIEYVNKDKYFRDVNLFVDHARDFVDIKGEEQMRTNLWTCLTGRAMNWWIGELGEDGKRLVKLALG